MEYSIEYRFFRNMEYSKNKVLQRFLIFFGIWNILAIKIFDFFFKYEYGIFQKKAATTKLLKNLEYGIFHGIFLEYSKKSITTVGGVKFNQAKELMPNYLSYWHSSLNCLIVKGSCN